MIKKTALNSLLRTIWYSFLICIFGLYGISLLFSITEPQDETTRDLYLSFNPHTVLDTIRQNKLEEAFILQPEDFEPDFDLPSSAVKWEQNDFLQVAKSLHEFVVGDNLGDWVLYGVYFRTGCEKIEFGPQDASLFYYKNTRSLLIKTRYTALIDIDTSANYVRVKTETIRPVWEDKKPIDLYDIDISVNEALRLAENNGGNEVRRKVKNNCVVTVSLMPNIGIENWKVRYLNGDDSNLLEITIDQLSGEVNHQ